MLVGTLRLTTHRSGNKAWAVDHDGLDHPRTACFGTEPVVGAQGKTRPTPHVDLDGFTIAHECEQPLDAIAEGNEAREVQPLHGFETECRPALGVAAPCRHLKLDQQGLKANKVVRLREVGEYCFRG